MAVLQVRDIDDRLYESLKSMAKQKRRSISQQVIKIIETYLANPALMTPKTQTDAFLRMSGSWEGQETAEELIQSIRKSRKNSNRFEGSNGLFD